MNFLYGKVIAIFFFYMKGICYIKGNENLKIYH